MTCLRVHLLQAAKGCGASGEYSHLWHLHPVDVLSEEVLCIQRNLSFINKENDHINTTGVKNFLKKTVLKSDEVSQQVCVLGQMGPGSVLSFFVPHLLRMINTSLHMLNFMQVVDICLNATKTANSSSIMEYIRFYCATKFNSYRHILTRELVSFSVLATTMTCTGMPGMQVDPSPRKMKKTL